MPRYSVRTQFFPVRKSLSRSAITRSRSRSDDIFRSGDSDYMVSLARGLHVIQVFCDDDRARLSIADVTRLSGLSRTVVSRCLYTLRELGFVSRQGRHFYLLPKVLKLGYGYVSTASLPTLAQPILERLAAETVSPSAIVVLDGPDVLYVARSMPPSYRTIIAMTVNIGHRRPAYLTASGMALLGYLPEADLRDYLASLDETETRRALDMSVRDIAARVADARRKGYALTRLIFARSVRGIAVPIRNVVGKVTAAMSIAIYNETATDEELVRRHLPGLNKAAKSLSDKLVE